MLATNEASKLKEQARLREEEIERKHRLERREAADLSFNEGVARSKLVSGGLAEPRRPAFLRQYGRERVNAPHVTKKSIQVAAEDAVFESPLLDHFERVRSVDDQQAGTRLISLLQPGLQPKASP